MGDVESMKKDIRSWHTVRSLNSVINDFPCVSCLVRT